MANYFMQGGDNKEYGPATAEQIWQWAAEGRANTHTMVRLAESSTWVPLGTVPELQGAAHPLGGNLPSSTPVGPFPAPSNAPVPAHIGGPENLVRRLAQVLASGGFWIKLMALLMFISGAAEALSIAGLIIAWLPIWMGVLLWTAANRAQAAASSGSEAELYQALDKLRFYFKLSGILLVVGFVIGLLWMAVALPFVLSQARHSGLGP
jgi:hypothetical protein